ncbi:GntR family transcriptional regulator [Escherichia coli]|uniref:GntR family transcriptional regulator n=1 Tax=Escherichia coli TaxID=562 RepID=A0A377E008_ECOLX|nr:GntR family transcriptional regulator [Escherichia coli]
MPLSAQQLAAQKNLSYVLAEKLAQRILKGEYEPAPFCPVRLSWASNLE